MKIMNPNLHQILAKVLMVGPELTLHGGIVSVVKGYMESGLPEACGEFEYLGTGAGTNLLGKSLVFADTLLRFKMVLPKYDIVHLHISARGSYKRKSIMARIAHGEGKRVILHEHDGEFAKAFEEGGRAYRSDVRDTFGIADRVVLLSEEWRDYFAENVCDADKITVVHNGVKVPVKPCSPSSHRDVLFLGRLDANKSPDVLLFASKDVLVHFPDTKIVFGGDGEVEKNIRLAEELGIADSCEFHGWVSGEEREKLFERAGVYCLPSKNEGMPMSVLEAMARGLPTIATPVGGVPRVIENEVNGFLMSVDDKDGLAKLLYRLLDSQQLRASIGAAGREVISNHFNIERNIDELIWLYKELMD